jgi:hypothetical protein
VAVEERPRRALRKALLCPSSVCCIVLRACSVFAKGWQVGAHNGCVKAVTVVVKLTTTCDNRWQRSKSSAIIASWSMTEQMQVKRFSTSICTCLLDVL